MSIKNIFIIIISVLLTLILMNNTEIVTFWLFGTIQTPKLVVLGVVFILGFIVGILTIGSIKNKPTKKNDSKLHSELDDEDSDYIH